MGSGVGDKKMTKREQKIKNTELRTALRKGELPYHFEDMDEKNYRKIIYSTGRELGVKFTVNKNREQWIIDIV